MKNVKFLLVLSITFLLFNCNKKINKADEHQFKGLWSLYIMEQKDTVTNRWTEWRSGMQGYILYDDSNNMAVHLTTKGYEKTNLEFPNFNDTISIEALKHLTGSYTYFSKYSVDKANSQVTHARISHSNPKEWNDRVIRKYTFVGDTLILEPLEKSNAELRLKWIRDSEVD